MAFLNNQKMVCGCCGQLFNMTNILQYQNNEHYCMTCIVKKVSLMFLSPPIIQTDIRFNDFSEEYYRPLVY